MRFSPALDSGIRIAEIFLLKQIGAAPREQIKGSASTRNEKTNSFQ